MSAVGTQGSVPGQSGVASSPGPMARDVGGCALLFDAMCTPESFDLDPFQCRMPFNREEYEGGAGSSKPGPGGLKIGCVSVCTGCFCLSRN